MRNSWPTDHLGYRSNISILNTSLIVAREDTMVLSSKHFLSLILFVPLVVRKCPSCQNFLKWAMSGQKAQ